MTSEYGNSPQTNRNISNNCTDLGQYTGTHYLYIKFCMISMVR